MRGKLDAIMGERRECRNKQAIVTQREGQHHLGVLVGSSPTSIHTKGESFAYELAHGDDLERAVGA
jgi:hypothetical protein